MTYDWKKMDVVPAGDLAAWHQYVPGESADNEIFDYSGNDRHLTAGLEYSPTLADDVLNGQPAWYSDGTNTPLTWSGELELRHIYVVAAFEDAEFAGTQGLLTGLSAGNILSTEGSGGAFEDAGASSYSLSGLDGGGLVAPVDGTFGIIEVKFENGIELDGMQVGRKLQQLGSLYKGYFVETLAYTTERNDFEQYMLARYFAMRYHLWPQMAAV